MENEKRKFSSKQYKGLFLMARETVNKHDPMGILIIEDLQKDEYDQEVARILPLLTKGLSLNELCSEIAAIFEDKFDIGPQISGEPYKPLAVDLMKLVEQ